MLCSHHKLLRCIERTNTWFEQWLEMADDYVRGTEVEELTACFSIWNRCCVNLRLIDEVLLL